MKRHSQNLYLSKSGIYYFRTTVPKGVRMICGCSEIKKSLATRDQQKARFEAELFRLYFTLYFEGLNKGMINDNPPIKPLINYIENGKLCTVSPQEARHRLEQLYLLQQINSCAEQLTPTANLDTCINNASGEPLTQDEELPPSETAKTILSIETAVDALTQIAERFNRLTEALGTSPGHRYIASDHAQASGLQPRQPSLAAATPYTLSDLITDYKRSQIAECKWSSRTSEKNTPKLNLLLEILGNLEMTDINRSSARLVQDTLQKLPPNKHKDAALNALPIQKIANMTHKKQLSAKTVNNHIDQYKALFRWAINEERFSSNNPFENMRISDSIKADQRREDFTTADLDRIFSHRIFRHYGEDRHDCPSRYWGPLIAATTGARANEIMCLETKNIVFGSVPHIDITVDDTTRLGESKRVKNRNSIRKVPIHPKLMELGLEAYVHGLQRKGEALLFPEAAEGKVRPGDKLGSWFNETLKKHVGMGHGHEKKVFHSFRHTVATMLYEAGCDNTAIEQLTGHSTGQKTVGQSVYTHPKLETLQEKQALIDTSFLKEVRQFPV